MIYSLCQPSPAFTVIQAISSHFKQFIKMPLVVLELSWVRLLLKCLEILSNCIEILLNCYKLTWVVSSWPEWSEMILSSSWIVSSSQIVSNSSWIGFNTAQIVLSSSLIGFNSSRIVSICFSCLKLSWFPLKFYEVPFTLLKFLSICINFHSNWFQLFSKYLAFLSNCFRPLSQTFGQSWLCHSTFFGKLNFKCLTLY